MRRNVIEGINATDHLAFDEVSSDDLKQSATQDAKVSRRITPAK